MPTQDEEEEENEEAGECLMKSFKTFSLMELWIFRVSNEPRKFPLFSFILKYLDTMANVCAEELGVDLKQSVEF